MWAGNKTFGTMLIYWFVSLVHLISIIPRHLDKPFLIHCFCLNLTGKILNDDTLLKEYKIDEKNFVVVMVTKVSATAPGRRQQLSDVHLMSVGAHCWLAFSWKHLKEM